MRSAWPGGRGPQRLLRPPPAKNDTAGQSRAERDEREHPSAPPAVLPGRNGHFDLLPAAVGRGSTQAQSTPAEDAGIRDSSGQAATGAPTHSACLHISRRRTRRSRTSSSAVPPSPLAASSPSAAPSWPLPQAPRSLPPLLLLGGAPALTGGPFAARGCPFAACPSPLAEHSPRAVLARAPCLSHRWPRGTPCCTSCSCRRLCSSV